MREVQPGDIVNLRHSMDWGLIVHAPSGKTVEVRGDTFLGKWYWDFELCNYCWDYFWRFIKP